MIECKLRRLYCPGCGDLPEYVEWARGGARYTRDFDDLTGVAGAADEPDAGPSASAQESAATSDHVASSSQELAGMAEQLNELVAKFTL